MTIYICSDPTTNGQYSWLGRNINRTILVKIRLETRDPRYNLGLSLFYCSPDGILILGFYCIALFILFFFFVMGWNVLTPFPLPSITLILQFPSLFRDLPRCRHHMLSDLWGGRRWASTMLPSAPNPRLHSYP